jgi:hypothetical protein
MPFARPLLRHQPGQDHPSLIGRHGRQRRIGIIRRIKCGADRLAYLRIAERHQPRQH